MNLDSKINTLYSRESSKITLTRREVEDLIDEIGTEIIVCWRLRTINFKKITDTRYTVSTSPFKG